MVDTKTKLIIYDSPIEPVKQIKFINSYLEQQEKNIICLWRNFEKLGPKEIISYLISIEAVGIFFALPNPLEIIQTLINDDTRLIKDKLTEHMKFYDSIFLDEGNVYICNSYAASFKKFIEDNIKDTKIYYDIDIDEFRKMFELIALFNDNIIEWKPGVVLRDSEVLFRTKNSPAISPMQIVIDDLNDLGKLGFYITSFQMADHFKETKVNDLLESESHKDLRNIFWDSSK